MSGRLVVRGTVGTVVWLIVVALYIALYGVYTVRTTQISYGILEPATLGAFLGGIFSPLVLGWFALLYYEQTRALRESVSEQRRALLMQVATDLRKDFTGNAFREHGIAIREFKEKCGPEEYWVVFHRMYYSGNLKHLKEIDKVDQARRSFSDYCDTVLMLGDDQLIMKLLNKTIVEYLHDTIWKLEFARDPNFDSGQIRFKRLWELYDLPAPERLEFPEVHIPSSA